MSGGVGPPLVSLTDARATRRPVLPFKIPPVPQSTVMPKRQMDLTPELLARVARVVEDA